MRAVPLALLSLLALTLVGCGGPGELSNADVAAKKAELNAGAPKDQVPAEQGDRGH